MSVDPYVYRGTDVLKNRLGITDADALERMERQLVSQRISEGAPHGDFDLVHLRAIHKHLFQDLFEWAGELRSVEISKGDQQFQFRRYIETGMADVHQRLVRDNYLQGIGTGEFCSKAGKIMGDVNYIHPFREGNGRVQLVYLEQLAEMAGHPIDITRLQPAQWIAASRAAHDADYEPMSEAIYAALSTDR